VPDPGDRNGGDGDVSENDAAAQNASARQYDWRPRPDPTVLTTQQLRETETALNRTIIERIGGLRELLEQRLEGMDRATELVAVQIRDMEGEGAAEHTRVRSEFAAADQSLRELMGSRIDGMDKANELLAANVSKFPSDIDRAVAALKAVLSAEIQRVQDVLTGEIQRIGDVTQEKFTAIDGTFQSNALALTAALAAQKEAAAEQNKSNTLAITKSESSTKETIAANAAQAQTGLASLSVQFTDVKERVVRIESSGVGAAGARTERRLDVGAIVAAIAVLVSIAAIIVIAFKKLPAPLPRTPAALASPGAVMGYCHRCGTYAALDQAAMCGTCRRGWQPAERPGDLGYHAQPQPPRGP
jgi:hypothetical protein